MADKKLTKQQTAVKAFDEAMAAPRKAYEEARG